MTDPVCIFATNNDKPINILHNNYNTYSIILLYQLYFYFPQF